MNRKQDIRPLLNVTCTVEELASTGIWPTGRVGIYESIQQGKIKVIRGRKRIRIICAPLRELLGIPEPKMTKKNGRAR